MSSIDAIIGTTGNDTLTGGAGADTISAGTTNNTDYVKFYGGIAAPHLAIFFFDKTQTAIYTRAR